ncbi:MAG TPA: hypothetical protein ENN03_04230 [bacterium]|nr:hypothetical protein [bacterium]
MLEKKQRGTAGLTGGLDAVIVNTEPEQQENAVREMLATTGYRHRGIFEHDGNHTSVLQCDGSADFWFRSRLAADNPFRKYNLFPKSKHLPNTRLEILVFRCHDLASYVRIQKDRGVDFMTGIQDMGTFRFIQTVPLVTTGTSIGMIQWKETPGVYSFSGNSRTILDKPDWPHLHNIGRLDHAALRVRAEDRDQTIVEFMELTNYHFDFAIYVKLFNSITHVTRLSDKDFAMVFTSGISPYISEEESGPTEKFIHHYGTRVHHLAFDTRRIESTFDALKSRGMEFLIELVGSPEEGLKQTFTQPSPHTLLVNEYIHRYGGFDGFFTRSNVTRLTESTGRQ